MEEPSTATANHGDTEDTEAHGEKHSLLFSVPFASSVGSVMRSLRSCRGNFAPRTYTGRRPWITRTSTITIATTSRM